MTIICLIEALLLVVIPTITRRGGSVNFYSEKGV